VAVTTAIYASWMLAQVPCIRFSTDFPSRSALENGSELRWVNAVTPQVNFPRKITFDMLYTVRGLP